VIEAFNSAKDLVAHNRENTSLKPILFDEESDVHCRKLIERNTLENESKLEPG
jgi:hypothetical protein